MTVLVGGFKYFLCSSWTQRKWSPMWLAHIFQTGGSTTNQISLVKIWKLESFGEALEVYIYIYLSIYVTYMMLILIPWPSFHPDILTSPSRWRFRASEHQPIHTMLAIALADLAIQMDCLVWWGAGLVGRSVHPWRLTWNIIMEVWKMIFLFN